MKNFFIQVLRFLKLDVLLLGLFEKIRLGLNKKIHKADAAIENAQIALNKTCDLAQDALESAQDVLENAQDALENFLC